MAKKKQVLVKDVLELMESTDKVTCIMYAYGVYYGDTQRDGMSTVKDCKEQMNHHCLNALVTRIRTDENREDVIIQAEIVHS